MPQPRTNETALRLRPMGPEDAETIDRLNRREGWHSVRAVYDGYFAEQQRGERFVFVAEWDGRFAGYVTLLPQAKEPPFAGSGLPLIADLRVYPSYRRRGIGTRLLDAAEAEAGRRSDTVALSVGLHAGYGAAQRLYAKRGYLPDGTGLWYQGRPLEPYTACCNDDDLLLHLTRRLGETPPDDRRPSAAP